MLLGDRISKALAAVGVTEAEVSRWLGAPCGCDERRMKANQLDLWARRFAADCSAEARRYLTQMLADP